MNNFINSGSVINSGNDSSNRTRGKNRANELEAKETQALLESGLNGIYGASLLSEAEERHALLEAYIRDLRTHKRTGNVCVFISHRSADKNYAEIVGNHLNKAGLEVYLDKYDAELQQATQEKYAAEVVWHIQKAISVSTHILILLSKNTQGSWWVPYEVGYAKRSGRKITVLLAQDVKNPPEYLEIEEQLRCEDDFWDYVQRLQSENGQCRVFLEERGF